MHQNRLLGQRVLIVEDEIMVAIDLEQTMKNAGCTIAASAKSLELGYAALEEKEIDFAVLDVNLGEANVFPLAEKLRAKGIPFFFLTGYSREHFMPEEFRDCVCLEKPIDDSLLLRTAAKLVGT